MTPPPEIQALLDAYTAATNLPVTLSYERERALSDLHRRSVQPDDITAVCRELSRLVRSGAKGYAESSLDFRNALGNPDVFEERMLRLRQRELRKRKPPVPATEERKVGGNVISFLVEKQVVKEPEPVNVPISAVQGLWRQIKQA